MRRVLTCAGATIASLALLVSACGDDGGSAGEDAPPAATGGGQESSEAGVDPGPNPTLDDPGPNDTSDGPETIQGTVVLAEDTGCITLRTDDGDLDVAFVDYSRQEADGAPAVVGTDGFVVAHDGDSMIVAGYRSSGSTDCGESFDVESLVNVTPAS